ncbi:MAG: extracellular solute-binding protein [Anaerolineae bacterium]|nr:extracellular solute-binding protein [Anaerolineae bacterium]
MFSTRQNFKKGALLPLLLVLMLLAVAACGGAAPAAAPAKEEAAEPEAEAVEEEAAVEEAEEAPSDEVQEVTLSFWTFVDAHADFYLAQAERFNEAHPNIKITLEPTSSPYQEMHDKLLIALQSGAGAPDIVDIEIGKFGTFLRGDIQLHDLSPIVDKHKDDLIQERLAPYQFEGVQYGIPTHLGAFVMYYNTELLEQAGVDVDSIVTWDDYIEAGKKVKEETGAMMATVETTDRFTILSLMLQNGGGTYDAEGNLVMDSPANVEAVQLLSDMYHKHQILDIAPGGYHHDPSYYTAINNGEYASVWMPQWYMIRFKEFMPDLEGKMVVRPMPVFKEGGFVSTMGGGTGTTITKQIDPDKVDIAMEFLEFSKLTYDANVLIWTNFGLDPFRLDVYDDPALNEADSYFSDEKVMQNIKGMLDNLAPEYTGPYYPEAVLELRDKIAFEIIEENGDPATLLKASAEQVQALQP